MTGYFRPIPQFGPARPKAALPLAGGWTWFDTVELIRRDRPAQVIPASQAPAAVLERLTSARPDIAGMGLSVPRLMGILNVTPDSFSDGGIFDRLEAAIAHARKMATDVDIIDIGGESTRPGAAEVPVEQEIQRTAPVISALRASGVGTPISIDTRKAAVAQAALDAGASMINDVSGLGFDPAMLALVAGADVPLCLMHAAGRPETMQADPRYDSVLLDIYDFFEVRLAEAEAAGLPRQRIAIDPGIGFGKTLQHNLALLARLSLFHTLGCPILLGASRKRFIGTIGQEAEARRRLPGSVAVALAAISQGVQILRIHDTAETLQALRLYMAAMTGKDPGEER